MNRVLHTGHTSEASTRIRGIRHAVVYNKDDKTWAEKALCGWTVRTIKKAPFDMDGKKACKRCIQVIESLGWKERDE